MRVLVAGTFAGSPGQGGASWAILEYALGLRELGHDVIVVDPCPRSPEVVAYYDHVVAQVGLEGRAALVHPGRRATGIPYGALIRWAADADVLLNLAGVLADRELMGPVARRVYVDLDPAFTQLWATVEGIDMGFDGHHRFVTVGQAVGTPACAVPTCGLDWIPTLPPVALTAWPPCRRTPAFGITTVANWRSYGSVTAGGVRYGQKAHAMRSLFDLPGRLPDVAFEPAISIDPGEQRDLDVLNRNGWRLRDPRTVAGDPSSYRSFLSLSAVELGVAKSGYITSRCGWFSDRSACYLASGRPVVAQDTTWTEHLPTGPGLVGFTEAEEAADAIADVLGNYERHRRGARAIAEELLNARVVLPRLLELAGETA